MWCAVAITDRGLIPGKVHKKNDNVCYYSMDNKELNVPKKDYVFLKSNKTSKVPDDNPQGVDL